MKNRMILWLCLIPVLVIVFCVCDSFGQANVALIDSVTVPVPESWDSTTQTYLEEMSFWMYAVAQSADSSGLAPPLFDDSIRMQFGFRELGKEWLVTTIVIAKDSLGGASIVPMISPLYSKYDVNRDGKTTIGDISTVIWYVFGR